MQRWILAWLRHQRFFSLAELNGAIAELVERLNDRTMRSLGTTRRALFEQFDQPALLPPAEAAKLRPRRLRPAATARSDGGMIHAKHGRATKPVEDHPFVVEDAGFTHFGCGSAFGIPVSVWLLFAFLAAGQFVLSKTVYGRTLFAIGGNNEASRLAGLPTEWLRTSTYVVSGACSAVAGMIIASRLAICQADIGATMALDAIAIVVIGGTSLLGGEGAIWRTAIGMSVVAVLTNLLASLAVDANYGLCG